uniref:Uncharacterized protein n=1 Tax=Romanomermis culicivorax TaxID=13658 RepID=A0A915KH06_ROMCU
MAPRQTPVQRGIAQASRCHSLRKLCRRGQKKGLVKLQQFHNFVFIFKVMNDVAEKTGFKHFDTKEINLFELLVFDITKNHGINFILEAEFEISTLKVEYIKSRHREQKENCYHYHRFDGVRSTSLHIQSVCYSNIRSCLLSPLRMEIRFVIFFTLLLSVSRTPAAQQDDCSLKKLDQICDDLSRVFKCRLIEKCAQEQAAGNADEYLQSLIKKTNIWSESKGDL